MACKVCESQSDVKPINDICTCGKNRLLNPVCTPCIDTIVATLDIRLAALKEIKENEDVRDLGIILGKINAYEHVRELLKPRKGGIQKR